MNTLRDLRELCKLFFCFLRMKIGIYKISCRKNGRVYIGETTNIERRWEQHKRLLKNHKHGNKQLQGDWNKYGEESFIFEEIDTFETDKEYKGYSKFLLGIVLQFEEYLYMIEYSLICRIYNWDKTFRRIIDAKDKKAEKYLDFVKKNKDILTDKNLRLEQMIEKCGIKN